jgi:hypothetical protein
MKLTGKDGVHRETKTQVASQLAEIRLWQSLEQEALCSVMQTHKHLQAIGGTREDIYKFALGANAKLTWGSRQFMGLQCRKTKSAETAKTLLWFHPCMENTTLAEVLD